MHPTSWKRFNVTNRYDKGYNQNIENEPEYLNTSRTHLLVKVITITLPSSRHLMLSSVLPGRFLKLLHCLYIIIPTRFPMSLSYFSIHGVFTGIILDFATALRRKLEVFEHVLRRPNCIPAGEGCADNSSTLDFDCACLLFNNQTIRSISRSSNI